jgi:hypothetical protein
MRPFSGVGLAARPDLEIIPGWECDPIEEHPAADYCSGMNSDERRRVAIAVERLMERANKARLESQAISQEAMRLIEDARRALRQAGTLATLPRTEGEQTR